MKNALFLLIMILLAPSLAVAESVTPLSTDMLNQWPVSIYPTERPFGSVKLIDETAYTMSENGKHREFKYRLLLTYDPKGFLLSEEYFNEDGSPGNRIDYTYENDMLVLKTQSHPNVINPDREIFTRSTDGRILEAEKIFSKGNYGWKFKNSYDHTGRIILTSKYDRYWKWQLVYSRMFEYDEAGRLAATEGFGMKSELLWRDEHYYDEYGRLTESVKLNPKGELVVRILSEFNESEHFTRREFFDAHNELYAVYSYGWNYDDKGNWIAEIVGREVEGSSNLYIVPDSLIIRDIEYFE